MGKREIRYEGKSEFSGPFVIEDTTGDNGDIFRRLIFLQNQNVVQSEAKLKSSKYIHTYISKYYKQIIEI